MLGRTRPRDAVPDVAPDSVPDVAPDSVPGVAPDPSWDEAPAAATSSTSFRVASASSKSRNAISNPDSEYSN